MLDQRLCAFKIDNVIKLPVTIIIAIKNGFFSITVLAEWTIELLNFANLIRKKWHFVNLPFSYYKWDWIFKKYLRGIRAYVCVFVSRYLYIFFFVHFAVGWFASFSKFIVGCLYRSKKVSAWNLQYVFLSLPLFRVVFVIRNIFTWSTLAILFYGFCFCSKF